MIRFAASLAVFLAGFGAPTTIALAASFDCGKATTPFEKAICGNPDLSAADERLAKTYATAIGGLSETALAEMRRNQRDWLTYAQRACTRDAKPLTSGEYDERGLFCLVDIFKSRSAVLEQSRMVNGLRFYPIARYEAMPDPYEAENPDSYWPVARHELALAQLDRDADFADTFNALVRAEGEKISPSEQSGDDDEDSSSDTDNSLSIAEVAGTGRITLKGETYWYGHGAAHGNWGVTYYHYLVDKGRWLQASDIFAGKGWQKALLELAVAAAEAEHGDNLMLDDTSYIADAVIDPSRWDLSDPYALIIQFQPYEISAYAYGAPEVHVRWDDLDAYLADSAESARYGN